MSGPPARHSSRRSRDREPARCCCEAFAVWRKWAAGPIRDRDWLKSGCPGTICCFNACKATTTSRMPEAAIRWPKAHLKAVVGGMSCPKTLRNAAASEASEALVPLPCATIIPISLTVTRHPRAPTRLRGGGRHHPNEGQRSPAASVTEPEPKNSPRMAAPRVLAEASVSSNTAPAPSPKTVPFLSTSNGRTASGAISPS